MSIKRNLSTCLLCLSALALTASAQKKDREMDPDIKNYKLSMEKIRAYDVAVHKLFDASATDPSIKSGFKEVGANKTLKDMVTAVEGNPKMMAVVKTSGLSAREFCLIPMSVMAAGGAYMIKTQYNKDASSLATAENIEFYGKNKDEIVKITNSWMGPDEK